MIDAISVQSYYTTDGDKVYLHRKIGNEDWEIILTPFKEVPYMIVTYHTDQEVKELKKDKYVKILSKLTVVDLINELNRKAKYNWEICFHTKDGKKLFDINYPDSPTPDYEDYSSLEDALLEVMKDMY